MSGMPRYNEPRFDDVERGVRDASRYTPGQLKRAQQRALQKKNSSHPHTETKVEAAASLGETGDEYGMKHERDLRVDMPEGQDLTIPNPDAQIEGPAAPELVEGGFAETPEERPQVEE